ncbi:ribosomal RNA small subunit methyltransferase G [Acidiphilium multivorum AIU301]|uniref:Ribosomal RNA small subunit methyltransferase G n=1 Tax=Acidiphilium multivorum (strain DSM 11245 / JCM 8867 / NBRC 100883 / AIU 301) TaxID=926570 RepID=F0J3D4_ACIMA|nr:MULTISPECIES: 16S rRNA (guanine(527)-N(7))-methyltransferase RsmG [Acidiphilium]BAJ82080.1 ribosomal RNA small subunit methyltransferase G [Acidiphilium multivorum AIU301]
MSGGGGASAGDVSRETRERIEALVSRETLSRLEAFAALILRWTARINLVSRKDAAPAEIWSRHILDSLQMLPLVPQGAFRAADLGSGGGLPGLVLAIARPEIGFTLIESDRRKAAFLQTAIAELKLNATVLSVRIEQARLEPSPLVTARALAALPVLFGYAAPLLAPGGVCLFLKGRGADAELTAAAEGWQMRAERFPSQTDAGAAILRISELRRAA